MSRRGTDGFDLAEAFTADQGDLARFATHLLSDREAAADVVSEVYVRMYERGVEFEDRDHSRRWAFVTARNICTDLSRRSRHAAAVRPGDPPERDLQCDPAVALEANTFSHRMESALGGLRENERCAILMRDAYGASIPEVAATIGSTVGSTRVLLTRTRRRLRESLDARLGVVPALFRRMRFSSTAPAGAAGVVDVVAGALVLLMALGAPHPSASVAAPSAVSPASGVTAAPFGASGGPSLRPSQDLDSTAETPWPATRGANRSHGTDPGAAGIRLRAAQLDIHETSRPATRPVVSVSVVDDFAGSPDRINAAFYDEPDDPSPPVRACATVTLGVTPTAEVTNCG